MKNLMIVLQDTAVAVQSASSGKSEVVVAVISVLFAGIVVYLISLDRKIRNLEK